MYAAFCICETCDAPLFYDGIDPQEFDFPAWPELVYPKLASFGNEVPTAVRQIYSQATRCKETAPSAFAILIRKALESICDDRGIPKGRGRSGSLAYRLAVLVQRGDLPPNLAKMTDVLRSIGNAAAHDEPTEITAPMTWAIDDFFQAVVEYVYVAPAKLEKFEQGRERAKKARNRRGA